MSDLPYQRVIGELELRLVKQQDSPPDEPFLLEISRKGNSHEEVFHHLTRDQLDELQDALDDIREQYERHAQQAITAWRCQDCGQVLLTRGEPATCDCGAEDWDKDDDLSDLSDAATTALTHLYVLEPEQPQQREDIVQAISEESGAEQKTVSDGIDELIDIGVLEENDGRLERY
ncbi:MAG: hypothetical protein SV186_00125 [Candidatus Nanohaloarchaea archaeon]|nr:hypothetical protein [Candidatus Nanohaloarchaea archaeon]